MYSMVDISSWGMSVVYQLDERLRQREKERVICRSKKVFYVERIVFD